MKKIIKWRWAILIIWAVVTVVLAIFTPNLNNIINQRGNETIAQSYPSQVAQKMIDGMSSVKGQSGIFVFYDKNTLSQKDLDEINTSLQKLKANESKLGVTGIIDSFDLPQAKSQLVSKDNTTMLTQFTYELNGRDIQTITNALNAQFKDLGVSHYITGGDFISNDFLKQTSSGVAKSAIITVIFILIILIVMFRSVVTPLISLVTVGISYFASMGVVGQLIEKFGFPVSSLTQMFLILILFGIGTDYNILLYNRFREELPKHENIDDAISVTFKTAGKTVVYSATTIFIAFLSLSFVKFAVYRSAIAVSIGIVVLVTLLMTFTPVMFRLLGKRLFWPSKSTAGHKQSKVWEQTSSFTVRHPSIAMGIIILLIIPVLIVGSYKLSFDNLKDMGNSSPSVIGFNTVSDHFSKGTTMPTTIVISSKTAMDNNESLAAIDALTNKIKDISGVSAVQGPTQPLGAEIPDYYSTKQLGQVVSGLQSANTGIKKIGTGLSTIHDKLTLPDFSQVSQLTDGTSKIQGGMQSLTDAMKKVQTGISSGATGADSISAGIEQIRTNLATLGTTMGVMSTNYSGLASGFQTFGDNYNSLESGISGVSTLATTLNNTISGYDTSDPQFASIKQESAQLSATLSGLDTNFQALNTQYASTVVSFTQLNAGLSQISGGIAQMVTGLAKLEAGQKALSSGLKQGSAGQGVIADNMQSMSTGLIKIAAGESKLDGGLSTVGSSLSQLKTGLGASSDGLKQISDGIDQSNEFLTGLSASKTFYIPTQAFQNSEFQKSLDAYMSSDRKTVKLTVVLKDDPYSDPAIATVMQINTQLPDALKGTPLSSAKYAVGGQTSFTNDIHGVAISDMSFTQIIVIAAIFIVLILIIKSFWIPVFIIGSLIISFYTSISLTSIFAKVFLHTSQIAWNVPFFGFLIIVALGVDYSIFLMMRFKEYRGTNPNDAIVKASSNVGGVVLSAAIILAGTFATLAPSGINTLIEMAVCVCIGIILLSVFLLPAVIPAFIGILDNLTDKYSFQKK